jgi:pimeloyl-ACP methyl ester carboxylesterase
MLRLILAVTVVLGVARVEAKPSAFAADVTGAKGARAVILIPGLGCPGSVWTQTAAHLGKTYEVHVLSLAGFAGSAPIDRPIPSAVKDDVIAYIKDKHLEKPVIVGHSMGGFIALWIAEAAPSLIGSVVVVDSGPTLGGGDPDMVPFAQARRDEYKKMDAKTFAATIRERFSPMFTDPKKPAHDAILVAVAKSDQNAYAEALYEISTVDLRPNVSKITAPALLMLANSGTPREDKLVKWISDQMKPAKKLEVVVLPTRHFVMHDDFAAFAKALDKFLVKNA